MGSTPPRPMGAPGRHYDALTARRAGAGIVESGIASAVQAALYDRRPHGSRVPTAAIAGVGLPGQVPTLVLVDVPLLCSTSGRAVAKGRG